LRFDKRDVLLLLDLGLLNLRWVWLWCFFHGRIDWMIGRRRGQRRLLCLPLSALCPLSALYPFSTFSGLCTFSARSGWRDLAVRVALRAARIARGVAPPLRLRAARDCVWRGLRGSDLMHSACLMTRAIGLGAMFAGGC
jgi:hypothetical protein